MRSIPITTEIHGNMIERSLNLPQAADIGTVETSPPQAEHWMNRQLRFVRAESNHWAKWQREESFRRFGWIDGVPNENEIGQLSESYKIAHNRQEAGS